MIYTGKKTKSISFPLGGIGSGCIGLAGNGALVDWEIFNRPNKNSNNGYSHFAIKVKANGKSEVKVLQGDTNESFMGMNGNFGFGPRSGSMAGFPHFKNVEFEGMFPIAKLKFSDDSFPVDVKLTAFSPFIPHDDYNSSLPAAFFCWEIENLTDCEIDCAVAFSVKNPSDKSYNEKICCDGYNGIFFNGIDKSNDEIGNADLCVITDCKDTDIQAFWQRGAWMDTVTTFWKDFSADGHIKARDYSDAGKKDTGSVVANLKISPKSSQSVRFVLAWNVPNQYNYWSPYKDDDGKDVIWKNYYATQFENSMASAKYSIENFSELYGKTKLFSDALQNTSLPTYMIDAISANLSVLKSPTVLRLQDGSLWAWEGCSEKAGSCEGSCQHVWNYAYALPFLFPKLERSLRENTIKYALYETGKTSFRISLPIGRECTKFRACVDGQMGEVIKCYREWKISGDDEWIKKYAHKIFSMLEYAWSESNPDKWDENKDGIIEGRQHHTLDMELFGANSWLEGFYLLALDCAAEIAEYIGDTERAVLYRKLYQNGKQWTNENLFNGQYFSQKIDLHDRKITEKFDIGTYWFGTENYWNEEAGEIKYQIADGCMIDQMLADWHSAIIGTDSVFENSKKQVALNSLYKNNYKTSMRNVTNMWRNFALDDESGTIICSYPEGVNVPAIPIPYVEECMTGFEYALAGLMIANGFIDEGETIVKAVRDRYDGEKRNPWNEIECGSNYARSMASYALLPICSGFEFDMSEGHIGFSPITSAAGQYFWSVCDTWGTVKTDLDAHTLCVCGEPLSISSYTANNGALAISVRVDGKGISFKNSDGVILFDCNTVVKDKLEIVLK